MPSEYSPADDHDVQPFPDITTAIGENPARFLDRDLLATTPDGQSQPMCMTDARIRGIDYEHVAEAYLYVELNLDREECPRSGVIARLNERLQWLREHGDRHERARYRAEPGTVESDGSCVEWNTDDGKQRTVATSGWSR